MTAPHTGIGRNATSVAAGENGLLFKKRIVGPRADAERRFRNSLRWDRRQRENALAISPPLVGYAEDDLELTYEYVTGATSLQSYVDALATPDTVEGPRRTGETATPVTDLDELLETAAALVAEIHTLAPGDVGANSSRPGPDLNPGATDGPLRKFVFLTPDEFAAASGAELECWRLFHHDEPLLDAIRSWVAGMGDGECVSVHGDLRPDQFLVTPEGMSIIDWEEFGIGPPTRDVAGLVGAVVFDALYSTFTTPVDGDLDPVAAHRETMKRGGQMLRAVAGSVHRLINAYERAANRRLDPVRLATDVGWYLIERVLARSMVSQRIAAFDKAIAGIGRRIMLRPELLATLNQPGGHP